MTTESETDTVIVHGAPPIPGLSFRRFRGDSDFPVMADVMQRSRDADHGDYAETVDDIASEFKHIQNCDPKEDLMFVEVDGTAIGLCRCEWHDAFGNVRTYNHAAHLVPEWRKERLRRTMLLHNEKRLREIASTHETDRGRVFEARATYEPNDWKDLLEQEGYSSCNHSILMTRSIMEKSPDIPLPEGYVVKRVEKDDTRRIWKACEEAMREEPTFTEEFWTEEGFQFVSGLRIFRPELWQIAWAGDEVAGGVLNFIDVEENARYGRNWGYTQGIFVAKAHRGRGLASALIARSFDVLRNEGVEDAALTVDTLNPSGALRLYEKLGFRTRKHYAGFRKAFA